MNLLEELMTTPKNNGCKICTYLESVAPPYAAEWDAALAKPVDVVGNTAIQTALRRRGVIVEETSVRRHRRNHTPNPG
jgi:hypothetical protein